MSSARRLAAIDVGSNTVHLLVADVIDGRLRDVLHEVTMPRVGEAVDATGRVGPAKITEVAADVRRLAALAREHSAETLLLGATEAVRRAADRDAVLRAASEAAGVPCQVIPAEVEARLSFRGATGAHPAGGPVLVADIAAAPSACSARAGGSPRSPASRSGRGPRPIAGWSAILRVPRSGRRARPGFARPWWRLRTGLPRQAS